MHGGLCYYTLLCSETFEFLFFSIIISNHILPRRKAIKAIVNMYSFRSEESESRMERNRRRKRDAKPK